VTLEAAREAYGVVLDPGTGAVDIAATEKLRSQTRAERVRRHARPGRKLTGRVLLHATQTLDIREAAAAEPHHACAKCATDLGGLSENYKEHCIREDHPISEANPLIGEPARFIDDQPVFRQFFCIGCGVLIENEVTLTQEPVLRDLAFDLRPAMRTAG
jgi:acetone carboxylase gamma subunit